jgi:penicillin-binding protein 1A
VAPDRRRSSRQDLELARLIVARHARERRRRRRGRSVFSIAALVLVSIIAVFVATAAIFGQTWLDHSCSLKDLRPLSVGENSFVYAANGHRLGVVPSDTNRQPLPLGRMSPWLPKATVAIEDARFWSHGALDIQGIGRALWQDVTSGQIEQGGSTLTQQLVRNLYIGDQEKTLTRKLKEACLADNFFSKLQERYGSARLARKQILSDYLNQVFYGRHAFGVQAASETFFSKDAKDLSLSQAALIAGLPQAPTSYNPFVNPKGARARRNEVLQAMRKNGYITRGQYLKAVHKPLLLRPGHLYTKHQQQNFFDWVTQQLVDRYGQRTVEAGGLRVKTTLDPRLQALALQAAQNVLHSPTDPATAIVAIDPRTGAVKAMVNYLPDGRQLKFILATDAHRSTGSAFKPITLATALEEGVSLYSTFYGPPELYITDPQCATQGGPNGWWDVHNSGDESAGTTSLLSATAGSINTIFAQLVAKVGVRNVVSTAHQLGITTHSGPNSEYFKPVCAITLGSVGFTPLELTDVYATFASGGIHHAPTPFERVTGPNGKVLYKLSTQGNRVLSPYYAQELTYALEGVVSGGTGTAASLYPRPVAGKTGTAEGYIDAWFCGYTPQLATCVWVGYPSGEIPLINVEGVYNVYGGTLPAQIWRDFMEPALEPLPILTFPTPSITGSYITGDGTYSYAPGYYPTYPSTTTTASTTTP